MPRGGWLREVCPVRTFRAFLQPKRANLNACVVTRICNREPSRVFAPSRAAPWYESTAIPRGDERIFPSQERSRQTIGRPEGLGSNCETHAHRAKWTHTLLDNPGNLWKCCGILRGRGGWRQGTPGGCSVLRPGLDLAAWNRRAYEGGVEGLT